MQVTGEIKTLSVTDGRKDGDKLKRLDGESFEDYKARRKADQIETKKKLDGTCIWYSYNGTRIGKFGK